MARLQRVTHKLFAENAPVVESGNTSVEIGQFGSALAGTYVATNDVATLQALPAYTRGWGGAIIADEQLPTLEDMNAVQRVQSYQTGYLFQEGIAEYDANSEYGIGSICKVINETDVKLYKSLIAENMGNPVTDITSWEELGFGVWGSITGDINSQTDLSNKLSNLIPDNSALIASYLVPDLTTEITRSNTGFTSEKVQWLYITGVAYGYDLVVFVNGVRIHTTSIGGTTAYPVATTSWFLLGKDDVVTVSAGTGATVTLKTYNCKGVQ